MAKAPWELFDELGGELSNLDNGDRAQRASRILAAIGETAGDALRAGRRSTAAAGAQMAKLALDEVRLRYGDHDATASFVAGRLAMLTDVLALGAGRRAPDDILDIACRMLPLLKAVHAGATSNTAIAQVLHIAEETACRQVREARAKGLLDFERDGRHVANRVSDLVLAFDEAGLLALTQPRGFSMSSILASTPSANEPPKRKEGVPQLQVAG